ncbi:MAG: FAD-dependent oxidoreductase [Caldilineaceae bacterium]
MALDYDVIVIGGGIIGASAAYHLVQAGARTLLLDRNDTGRATSAGAGIIAPELTRVEDENWFNFAVAAANYYPTLIDQLTQANAGATGYTRCGMLLVAATEDEVAPFAAAKQVVLARQQRRKAPSTVDLHPISAEAARQLFPALTAVKDALYYRHAARVDGRLITAALRRAAESKGLTIQAAGADSLVIDQQRLRGVLVNGTFISANAAIIAGGAWSSALGDQIGVQIPVEPQRGQIIHLDLPGVETGDWPVVNAFHGHYIVCWPAQNGVGRVVVGATRETGAGFAPHTTAAGIREVLSEALRVAPGLADAQLHEIRVGLRPLAVDGLPILGAAPQAPGVVIATGHGPNGLQLGPLSGKIAAGLALGRLPEVDITAFNGKRFA